MRGRTGPRSAATCRWSTRSSPCWGLAGGSSGPRSAGESSRCSPSGRALMARPKLLMLDEPSLGLAPMLVQEIFRTIVEFKREKRTVLLVEQNARKALQCADRGYVLDRRHRPERIRIRPPQERVRAGRLPGRARVGAPALDGLATSRSPPDRGLRPGSPDPRPSRRRRHRQGAERPAPVPAASGGVPPPQARPAGSPRNDRTIGATTPSCSR
jgi:hypothetical protein